MLDKFIIDINIDKLSKQQFKEIVSEKSLECKATILEYLKKFPCSAFTSAPVIDIFTDKEVKSANNGYTDGEYIWYESEIYYFEKYNLKLNNDFIEYVLEKGR